MSLLREEIADQVVKAANRVIKKRHDVGTGGYPKLDVLADSDKIQISMQGNFTIFTIARFSSGDRLREVFQGVSKRNPDDQFNSDRGVVIAIHKAVENSV